MHMLNHEAREGSRNVSSEFCITPQVSLRKDVMEIYR